MKAILGFVLVLGLAPQPAAERAPSPVKAAASEVAEVDIAPARQSPRGGRQYEPPFLSRELGLRAVAEVRVEFVVDESGAVRDAKVLKSTSAVFSEAAKYFVSRWQFRAGLKNGRPVRVRLELPVVFNVDSESILGGRPVISRFEGMTAVPDAYAFDTPPQPMVEPLVSMPEGFSRPGGGTAAVAVLVGETGEVLDIELTGSSHRACAEALITAVRPLRFKPARLRGEPVPGLWFHAHDFLPGPDRPDPADAAPGI